MATDAHRTKRTDLRLHERALRDRRAQSHAEELKRAEQASQRRKELWAGLAKYIHDNGGYLVSTPNEKRLRIEVPQGSALPVKLRELGYMPRHLNTGTRLQNGSWLSVDIISIDLPGK